jgi:hypothetical protein
VIRQYSDRLRIITQRCLLQPNTSRVPMMLAPIANRGHATVSHGPVREQGIHLKPTRRESAGTHPVLGGARPLLRVFLQSRRRS